MRSFSDQLMLTIPAGISLVMAAWFAAPVTAGVPLAPNVGFAMTLAMASVYPLAWPRWFAFGFGLLQDVAFGTPLGSQALLMVLLVGLGESQARRFVPFRLRWLEVAGMLLVAHLILWALIYFVSRDAAPILSLLIAGLVTALWYPLFYGFARLVR